MNVSLTPEHERYVAGRVASGQYPSADAVVRAALDAFRQQQHDAGEVAALRADLDAGLADLDAGRATAFTEDTVADIKARGRERKAARG